MVNSAVMTAAAALAELAKEIKHAALKDNVLLIAVQILLLKI